MASDSLLTKAKAVCDPIIIDIRSGPATRELSTSLLFNYQRKLGGWLSTLGEFAGEAYAEAETEKALAEKVRATVFLAYMGMKKSATGSEALANADPDRQDRLVAAAEARGRAKLLEFYHHDVEQAINVCKKMQDGILKVRELGA